MNRPASQCSLRILVVDDEPDLHLASAEVLRDAGHEVHVAGDGEQAPAICTALKIDVRLTDVRLPKLDGLSLFRLTRQQSPTTTVILVTAYAEVHEAIAAVREGAHDYLTKPVASEAIGRSIEQIAAQVSMDRELVKVRVDLARRES